MVKFAVVALVLIGLWWIVMGETPDEDPRAAFDRSLQTGATCAELSLVRERATPGSGLFERMGEVLSDIGCDTDPTTDGRRAFSASAG